MALVHITEIDNTQPGVVAQSDEVVFIPGFVGANTELTAPTPTAVEGEAYHITDLAQFTTLLGDTARKFEEGIKYDSVSDNYLISIGQYDPSYIMAKEYLAAGLAVQYYVIPTTTATTVADEPEGEKTINPLTLSIIADKLSEVFNTEGDSYLTNGFVDVGNYAMKYITSGGYPAIYLDSNAANCTLANKMLAFAAKRGDCVALIDHTEQFSSFDPTNNLSIYNQIQNKISTNGEFGAMFSSWQTYTRIASGKETYTNADGSVKNQLTLRAPASFAYLMALADSIQTNDPWLAVAGVTRGLVRNLDGTVSAYTNGAADKMQERTGVSVNGITNIQPYGYSLWGNRTLKKNAENLTATSFLNMRNLVSDVKKLCYRVARSCTFEQNNDVLWVNFKSKLTPTLDRMKSGYGISDYKIVRDLTHEKAVEKATLCAKVILYPVYAVEDFYITILLNDDEITVE